MRIPLSITTQFKKGLSGNLFWGDQAMNNPLGLQAIRRPLITSDLSYADLRKVSVGDFEVTFLDFIPEGEQYRCIACSEVGRSTTLLSPGEVDQHVNAHQMGFNYAKHWMNKHPTNNRPTELL